MEENKLYSDTNFLVEVKLQYGFFTQQVKTASDGLKLVEKLKQAGYSVLDYKIYPANMDFKL